MPVPRVVISTSPSLPLAAPNFTSATPAASASLTSTTGRPSRSEKIFSAGASIHDLSMFAAERVTPWVTTAGMVMPIGPSPIWSANSATISATTEATFFGVDSAGVGMRTRGAAKSPAVRSTRAPLIPEPPMSMPSTGWFCMGPP